MTAPAALQRLLDEVNGATARGLWDAAELPRDYCERSIEAVEASGIVPFSAPCADLSGLLARRALAAGLRPTLVLSFRSRPLRHVKFQCNIELETEAGRAVVGFSETAVHLFFGEVAERPDRPLILRKTLTEVDPSRSFLEHFHARGRDGLSALFSGYALDVDLKWHDQRNRRWRYHWTRWRSARKRGRTVYTNALQWR